MRRKLFSRVDRAMIDKILGEGSCTQIQECVNTVRIINCRFHKLDGRWHHDHDDRSTQEFLSIISSEHGEYVDVTHYAREDMLFRTHGTTIPQALIACFYAGSDVLTNVFLSVVKRRRARASGPQLEYYDALIKQVEMDIHYKCFVILHG